LKNCWQKKQFAVSNSNSEKKRAIDEVGLILKHHRFNNCIEPILKIEPLSIPKHGLIIISAPWADLLIKKILNRWLGNE
jgi:hypothetical protein